MDSEIKPDVIRPTDIQIDLSSIDSTALVLQRHEQFQREENNPAIGSLESEAFNRAKQQGATILHNVLAHLNSEERDTVDILVIASDTRYKQGGMRAMETGKAVMEGIQNTLAVYELSPEHIINNASHSYEEGMPRPTKNLREPNMFTEALDFEKFLVNQYGTGHEFWTAFEDDRHSDIRQELGAEGPKELGNRLAWYLDVLARYAEMYHRKIPGRRLLIWADTHYDTISPYIKQHVVLGREGYLPVEYGGGIAINLQANGIATTTIDNVQYPVSLHPHQ